MSVQYGQLGPVAAPEGVRTWEGPPAVATTAPAAAVAGTVRGADVANVVEASPPPSVLEEVAAAGERARQMAADNRELHFAMDPASGRIVVEVRDLEGNVLRVIPPSEALDLMSGHGSVH
jgi:hypothetical protein